MVRRPNAKNYAALIDVRANGPKGSFRMRKRGFEKCSSRIQCRSKFGRAWGRSWALAQMRERGLGRSYKVEYWFRAPLSR